MTVFLARMVLGPFQYLFQPQAGVWRQEPRSVSHDDALQSQLAEVLELLRYWDPRCYFAVALETWPVCCATHELIVRSREDSSCDLLLFELTSQSCQEQRCKRR